MDAVLFSIRARAAHEEALVASSASAAAAAAAALRFFTTLPRVQESALGALVALASREATNRCNPMSDVEAAGAPALALAAMAAEGATARVTELACALLARLAEDPEMKARLIAQQAVEAVIAAMQRMVTEPAVQEQGYHALTCLSKGVVRGPAAAPNRLALTHATGGVAPVVTAMAEHISHAGVQERGCGTLASLPLNAAEGAVAADAVLAALSAHPAHTGVLEKGCFALRQLASAHHETLDHILAHGAVEKVLRILNENVSTPLVAASASWAVGVLANTEEYESDDNTPVIIRSVLRAMAAHPAHPGVQEACAGALHHLAVDAHCKAVALEGLEQVIRAMRLHISEPSVQARRDSLSRHTNHAVLSYCLRGASELDASLIASILTPPLQVHTLWALMCLAVDETGAARIVTSRGLEAVMASMRVHARDPVIQERGAAALMSLAVTDDHRARAVGSGGIPATAAVLRRHKEHAPAVERAMSALICLCIGAENKLRAADAGALEAAVEVLQLHAPAPRVAERACWLLQSLTSCEATIVRATSAGACEAVLGALSAHLERPAVVERALACLQNLATIDDNTVIAAASGGVELVVRAMTLHMGNEGVAEKGSAVLLGVAFWEKGRIRAAPKGGVDAVIAGIKKIAKEMRDSSEGGICGSAGSGLPDWASPDCLSALSVALHSYLSRHGFGDSQGGRTSRAASVAGADAKNTLPPGFSPQKQTYLMCSVGKWVSLCFPLPLPTRKPARAQARPSSATTTPWRRSQRRSCPSLTSTTPLWRR